MATLGTPQQLCRTIQTTNVPPGNAALWWLYQAGFCVKSPGGTVLLIDPYLSDAVSRSYNQSRNVPPPLDAEEVDADAILATHPHEDHLDPDSLIPFTSGSQTQIIGPLSVVEVAVSKGVDPAQTMVVRPSEQALVGDITVQTVFARHMFEFEATPDAVGYLLTVGGVSLYHSGDTEYDAKILAETKGRVDVSLICINGTTGNMNAHEAALLAWQQRPALAIPMHYGLWRDADYGNSATLDPKVFAETLSRLGSGIAIQIAQPGELMLVCPTGRGERL